MKILIDFIKSKQELSLYDFFIPFFSYIVFYVFYYNFVSTDIMNRRVSNHAFAFFAIVLIIVRFIRFKKIYKK